jgi:hypothetical protein
MIEEFCFVITITGPNSSGTGKEGGGDANFMNSLNRRNHVVYKEDTGQQQYRLECNSACDS